MRTNNWIILEQIKTIKRASEIIKKLALKEKDYSLHFASLETERYMQNLLDKYEAKVKKEKFNIERGKTMINFAIELHHEMNYKVGDRKILCEGETDRHKFWIVSYGTHPCVYIGFKFNFFKAKGLTENFDEYGDFNLHSVHGGITFSDDRLPNNDICNKIVGNCSYYIGWDYRHCFDYTVYENLEPWIGKKHTTIEMLKETIEAITLLYDMEEGEEIAWS